MVWVVSWGYKELGLLLYLELVSTPYLQCYHHLLAWATVPWCYSWTLQPDSLQSKAEWYMPVISAVRELRQGVHDLGASLSYRVRPCVKKKKVLFIAGKKITTRWKVGYGPSYNIKSLYLHSKTVLCTCNDDVWEIQRDASEHSFWILSFCDTLMFKGDKHQLVYP